MKCNAKISIKTNEMKKKMKKTKMFIFKAFVFRKRNITFHRRNEKRMMLKNTLIFKR